jgi:DNA-binding NarL/FixJ family response regulator
MTIANQQPARVLIVEDQKVVADALRRLINDQPDMLVVGAAGSVAESLSCAAKLRPDILLLDYTLPDGTGVDAASALRQLQPRARLIFVTRDDREKIRLAAFEVGAKAFVHKSRAATELVGTIRAVAAGKSLLQPPRKTHGQIPMHDLRLATRRSQASRRRAERRVRIGAPIDPGPMAERRSVDRRREFRRSLLERRVISAR